MTVETRIAALRRDLARRFHLKDVRHVIRGRAFTLTTVEDASILLDRLAAAGPDDPDVRDERLPYWATLWRAALALTEVLLDKAIPAGCDLIELGSGLGLCTAAVCATGARVTATDYQPEALLFTRLNCLRNAGREPDTALLDWRSPPADRRYDFLIGSDLAYEARSFDPLVNCFDVLLAPGGTILFAEGNREIGRPFFPKLHLRGWRYDSLFETTGATVYRITR